VTTSSDSGPEVFINSSHKNPAVMELILNLCLEFDIEEVFIEIDYLPCGSELNGMASKISDSHYKIQLNRKLKGYFLAKYIIHEMIHIEQFYSGRLKADCEYYYFTSLEGKVFKYKRDTDYWQQYHEDEAHRCWKLYSRYINDIYL
jgi:hypothetical protein